MSLRPAVTKLHYLGGILPPSDRFKRATSPWEVATDSDKFFLLLDYLPGFTNYTFFDFKKKTFFFAQLLLTMFVQIYVTKERIQINVVAQHFFPRTIL